MTPTQLERFTVLMESKLNCVIHNVRVDTLQDRVLWEEQVDGELVTIWDSVWSATKFIS